MKPERWQQIRLPLQAALEREPAELSPFLDESCKRNELLRHQVNVSLAPTSKAAVFWKSQPFKLRLKSLANNQTGLETGQTLDHYRVLEKPGAELGSITEMSRNFRDISYIKIDSMYGSV